MTAPALGQPCHYLPAHMDEVGWIWEILAACEPVSWGRAGAPAHAAWTPLEAEPRALPGWTWASQASSQISSSCVIFWGQVLASAVYSLLKLSVGSGC